MASKSGFQGGHNTCLVSGNFSGSRDSQEAKDEIRELFAKDNFPDI